MVQAITIADHAPPGGDPTLAFHMTLRPRRSADPKVAYMLCGALGSIWFCAGMLLTVMGGWPVFGFFGAEFIFIAIMVHVFIRRTEVVEVVEISPQTVRVSRRNLGIEEKTEFPAYWTQVHFDGSPTDNRALEVRSHGKGVEIGAFLSASEKSRIADALAGVLRRVKAPPPGAA